MRLNRYLASAGVASRRGADTLIQEGRVSVNGEPVQELATFVEPGTDTVAVDGRVVQPAETTVGWLLHKPAGTVTTARDPQGRPTVVDLVPRSPRVYPVGRLDVETTGALLLTNDGDLAHRIAHPRYRLDKEYAVLAEGRVERDALRRLAEGVELPDDPRPTAPADVGEVVHRAGRTELRLVLHEGRNRQVRRMLEAVGHPVLQLRRVRIGPLLLGDLEPGSYRALTADELAGLRRLVGLPARRA